MSAKKTKTKTVKTPRVPATPRARKATVKTKKVIMVKVEDCTVSPLLACVPMTGDIVASYASSSRKDHLDLSNEMQLERDAFLASLKRHGIKEPLKMASLGGGKWMVHDGRHRLEWARTNGVAMVPMLEVTKEEGEALAFETVIGRRHWTKGQRAWLGVLQFPQVCDVSEGRPKNSDSIGVSATSLAVRLGVSADVVSQAVTLYRSFYAPGAEVGGVESIQAESLRTKYEFLIWGGAGLGGILAGIGGGESTRGEPKAKTGFHHLEAPLASLSRLSKAFTAWDAEERAKACALLTSRVKTSLSAEFRLALAEALAAAE